MKKLICTLLSAALFACGPTSCATASVAEREPVDPVNQSFTLMPTVDPQAYLGSVDVIRFEDEVNAETADVFMRQLQANIDAGQKIVVVQIDTPGGSISAGMDMMKAIERSPVPVACVVDTFALSMGLAILQSCDVRMMTGRSVLMGHQPAAGSRGQENDSKNLTDVLIALNHALAKHIVSKAKIDVTEYERHVAGGREWWINVEEAQKVGFIDFEVGSVDEGVRLARAQ